MLRGSAFALLHVVVLCASPVLSDDPWVPTLTGHADVDFPTTQPGVVVAPGLKERLVWADETLAQRDAGVVNNAPSGWDIHDLRYFYDKASDTAYFGEFGQMVGQGLCLLYFRRLP